MVARVWNAVEPLGNGSKMIPRSGRSLFPKEIKHSCRSAIVSQTLTRGFAALHTLAPITMLLPEHLGIPPK